MSVGALLLGAAALWASSRLVWFAESADGGVRGTVLRTQTGAERSGALIPLAVLALAGVAGMVATGGWPRRLLGGVLVAAGVAACWVALSGLRFGGHPEGAPVAEMYAAHGLAVAGGALIVVGGLLGLRKAGRMPRLGAKYSAPGAKRAERDPGTELWDALSDGEDPTTRS
ncbi:Trp biosynthesis-associated membrane protein [Prauserella shujinwangii]|nr:Trp biosynthesis-associated membrane protein [Prauserella shujinwangii]